MEFQQGRKPTLKPASLLECPQVFVKQPAALYEGVSVTFVLLVVILGTRGLAWPRRPFAAIDHFICIIGNLSASSNVVVDSDKIVEKFVEF